MKKSHLLLAIGILLYVTACSKSNSTNPPATTTPPKKTVTVPFLDTLITNTNLTIPTYATYVVSHDSVHSGGEIFSDGGATITAKGVCWSTSQNPTVANSKTVDGTGTGEFSSAINGLTVNTVYYLRAYATNSAGTGYSAQMTVKTAFIIGEQYEGGTIFYVDTTAVHGLIVAQYARTASVWGTNNVFVGATSLFDGAGNTNKIVQAFGTNAQNAAALCRACRDGGYTDWFLPALYQLELLGAAPLGDIDWSSTEYDSGTAYVLASPDQDNYADAKAYTHPARPVRAF